MNGAPPVRKAVPTKSSQDLGYREYERQDMYGNENADPRSYGSTNGRAGGPQEASGRVVLDGYRKDLNNGSGGERPVYNPLNIGRPQSSTLLNINDSIQVHLLVETALDDSKEFELLSQEEVDELKKQCQILSQRIAQTRQNLAIQSKYRDAASSMARLYSSSDKKRSMESQDSKKNRRSLLAHDRNSSDQFREAEQERIASEKKCEDLAAELWRLEKRLMVPQSRLLKHTAGILQMTHKGPKKTTRGQANLQQNGMPGSPESMYTYPHSRISIEPINEELFFDERSLYKSADRLDAFDDSGSKNSLIPTAQGKEQMQLIALTEQKLESLNNQLREFIIKANPQRNASFGKPLLSSSEISGTTTKPGDTLQSHLEYLERGLDVVTQDHSQTLDRHREALQMQQEILNNQQESFRIEHESMEREQESMRMNHEMMMRERNSPKSEEDDPKSQQEMMALQDNLSRSQKEISRLQDEVSSGQREISQLQEEVSKSQEESEAAMEETLEELNQDLRDILLRYDANRPELPQVTGAGLNDQLAYFQDSVSAIRTELERASNTAMKSTGSQDNLEQMETVIMGLWEIIRSGEEEERQRSLERRKARTAQNLPADEDDMSGDDDHNPNETFSLQGFSTKVQWLYTQATRLKDQKKVLKRQIKQQRELNSKSDATKDADIFQRQEELERTRALLARTEIDADEVRKQLSLVMERLDEARQQEGLREQSRAGDESGAIRAAQAEIEERDTRIAALEEELQDLKDDHSISNAEIQSKKADTETKIATLTQDLAAAVAAQAVSQASIDQKEKAAVAMEKELDEMNMEIARLQTEVTIARAELDGAYGSRAQRAAEVSSNPAIQKEIDDLTIKNMTLSAELANLREQPRGTSDSDGKMQTLKRELAETIEEYEQMTKASIEWEKEREMLEGTIDKLRDEREGLEAQLSDEKVRWLGMRSPGFDGPAPASTSTTVLKNEFKKMMRDTRAENAKILRAEQGERRRLEDELRNLKKSLGPGKSTLSQSIGT